MIQGRVQDRALIFLSSWAGKKGGLAVVRPRRASSIRQTTLVSHGRVQDGKSSSGLLRSSVLLEGVKTRPAHSAGGAGERTLGAHPLAWGTKSAR